MNKVEWLAAGPGELVWRMETGELHFIFIFSYRIKVST